MASGLYTPRLTRRRCVRMGNDYCVEYEGRSLFFRREDCRRLVVPDTRECLEIGGKVFPVMDEKMVEVLDVVGYRERVRCVEYVEDDGSSVLLLAVTGWKKEVSVVDETKGSVRVIGFEYDGYYDPENRTVEHVVDVQGAREAYALLVSVHQELGSVVRIKRLN